MIAKVHQRFLLGVVIVAMFCVSVSGDAPRKAYHVRIDRVTQGPDGTETPADRLSVNSEDFLWIYVEADLASGSAPQGEYFKMKDGKPDSKTRVGLGSPDLVNGQYRFKVDHFVLSKQSHYWFHFADKLSAPKYEDHWEIVTL